MKTDKGRIIWLCVDPKAEEGMARIDGTINLGFAGRVRFQAAGRCPGEKLEQQRDRLQQEQRKLQRREKYLLR